MTVNELFDRLKTLPLKHSKTEVQIENDDGSRSGIKEISIEDDKIILLENDRRP